MHRTMTPGRLFEVRRNVSSSVVAFTVNVVLVVASYRLVIAEGGLEALGLWSALMSWVYVLRIGDPGLSSAVARFVARCDAPIQGDRVRAYIDTGILVNGGLFLFLAGLGYGVFSTHIEFIVPDAGPPRKTAENLLPLLFGGLLASGLSALMLGALQGLHRGYLAARLSISGQLVQLVSVMLLVPRQGLYGLAAGVCLQHLVVLVAGWPITVRTISQLTGRRQPLLPIHASWRTMRQMMGFSLRAQVANITNGAFEPLSKILIGRYAGLETLGLFELAYKIVILPRNALVSGVQATTPAITRMLETDPGGARSLYARSVKLVARSAALCLGAVVIVSPIVSLTVVGQFLPVFTLFTAMLAIGVFANATGAPAFVLGIAHGRFAGNIVAAVISLAILGFMAVPAGLANTSVPMVAAVAMALTVSGFYIRRRNGRLLGVS